MSGLTTTLLNSRPVRNVTRWQRRLADVADILVFRYGTPTLGNYRSPTKEIFYILLSAKTTEGLYKAAYRRLWQRFPTLRAIAEASLSELKSCVEVAGLGAKRAEHIKRIAQRLLADLGPHPDRLIRKMSLEAAYSYLIALPGVGPKSALCVLMYSLNADVFPVDANIQRVLCRMGAIVSGAKHYHAQDMLPLYIPEGRSKELHVTLIAHARTVCRPITPLCEDCVIRHLCRTGQRRQQAIY